MATFNCPKQVEKHNHLKLNLKHRRGAKKMQHQKATLNGQKVLAAVQLHGYVKGPFWCEEGSGSCSFLMAGCVF